MRLRKEIKEFIKLTENQLESCPYPLTEHQRGILKGEVEAYKTVLDMLTAGYNKEGA